MGRNKACGPDDLLIKAIMAVGSIILQRIMANGIPDSRKKVNSYGNSVFTLNVKCPMPIKKHYR